jgi:hypothetical protein
MITRGGSGVDMMHCTTVDRERLFNAENRRLLLALCHLAAGGSNPSGIEPHVGQQFVPLAVLDELVRNA